MRMLAIAVLVVLVAGCTKQSMAENSAELTRNMIKYGDDFTGYLVLPEGEGKFPTVVMIHEWWGLNQNIKDMANELAKEGYIVLAVDLYDGKVANTSEEARRYVAEGRSNRSIQHLKSAAQFLRSHQNSNGKVASLGWCFGGGMSLQLSLNDELDATAIYYGNLVTDPEQLKEVESPVLGIFGEMDASIPVDSVREFENALDSINATSEIYVYEGVGHAFANPSNPGHDAAKTLDAWQKTIEFLGRNLKG